MQLHPCKAQKTAQAEQWPGGGGESLSPHLLLLIQYVVERVLSLPEAHLADLDRDGIAARLLRSSPCRPRTTAASSSPPPCPPHGAGGKGKGKDPHGLAGAAPDAPGAAMEQLSKDRPCTASNTWPKGPSLLSRTTPAPLAGYARLPSTRPSPHSPCPLNLFLTRQPPSSPCVLCLAKRSCCGCC